MADLTNTLTNLNNTQSSCETQMKISDEQRAKMFASNVYSPQNPYGATHVNSTQAHGAQDDSINAKGKGTGRFMDTSNGGGYYDIYGHPNHPSSGRVNLLAMNKYSPDRPFEPCKE